MKKTLRVNMVSRCRVYVSVDAEKFDNGYINLVNLEEEIKFYLNQGNWAKRWEIEDPEGGVVEVNDEPELVIE